MAVLREEAFVDSSKIESVSGLTYGVNRPVKSASNPVFTGTSGEFDHHVVYVSAIPDPDGSGVWLYPGTHTENWGRGRLALAQSADGITFTKPNLGLHTVDGDTNNNCVIDSTFKTFPFVTYVPSLTATPYVAVGLEIPVDGSWERYVKVWVSDDGIDFGSPVNSITITGMVRDSMSIVRRTDDKWMIYAQTRTGGDVRSVGVWRSDTTDITTTTWTFVNEFMLTGTSSAYQYYSFGAWIDGEVMYAANCIYDSSGYYQNETYPSPPTPVPFITTTTADRQFKFELWTSRGDDGLTWTRIDADWMWSGANAGALDTTPGEWDYGCMVIGGQMVRVGDDWRYYYGGAAEQHHPSPAGPYGTLPWTQREAGFASTGYRRIGKLSGTGSVILDPITAAGSGATVTVNSTGTVTVELLDATTGAVLSGYASADCDAIPSDTVDHTVTWGGASVTPDEFKVKVYVTSGVVHFIEVADAPGAEGYGNTTSSGYGEATAYTPPSASLAIDPASTAWEQIGTTIIVRVTADPSIVSVVFTSSAGGLVRFGGADADLFEVSLDGTTWVSMVDIPVGETDGFLRVTPETPGTTLSADIGVPV